MAGTTFFVVSEGMARVAEQTDRSVIRVDRAVADLTERAAAQPVGGSVASSSGGDGPTRRVSRGETTTRTVRRADGRGALPLLLSGIDGVGRSRQDAIVDAFGSVRGLRQASVDDIAGLSGIGQALAKRIHDEAAAHRN